MRKCSLCQGISSARGTVWAQAEGASYTAIDENAHAAVSLVDSHKRSRIRRDGMPDKACRKVLVR